MSFNFYRYKIYTYYIFNFYFVSLFKNFNRRFPAYSDNYCQCDLGWFVSNLDTSGPSITYASMWDGLKFSARGWIRTTDTEFPIVPLYFGSKTLAFTNFATLAFDESKNFRLG
jgi:hypothetical protein